MNDMWAEIRKSSHARSNEEARLEGLMIEMRDRAWESEAEVERLTVLIEQLMQIAHCDALFNGGQGDRDPVVGFRLIMAEWDRICEENDRYETEIERLTAELGERKMRYMVELLEVDERNSRITAERDEARRWGLEMRRMAAVFQLGMCTNDYNKANPAPWEE